ENTGSESLGSFKIQVFYENDTTQNYITDKGNTTLDQGEIEIFSNSSVSDNIQKVSFYSEDCPVQSRVEEDCRYIEGC
ncbi:MAG: hypothetical protein ABEJ72_04915, partial [Candidatus Aenigmatarchaeota archaeon]